ncbi:MAG: endonuclease/exonuclease/phosphatase family protein [Phycisphaerae bacterium]|nr:endonuclease/exonuclease/phosphatase family protein [Phycisphaerae bacterium]NUQ45869.1 endonuclease/exonuclease/phosphatase family protein [Phycisphaerae bacterium]
MTARILTCLVLAAAGCMQRDVALRVATLNLAHGRGSALSQIGLPPSTFEANLHAVAAVLLRERPDVLAVQEADAECFWSGRFDHVERLAGAGELPHRFHGLHVNTRTLNRPLRYGTALLSRLHLSDTVSHAFRLDALDTKGYVAADIERGGRRLCVVSVHLDFRFERTRRRQADAMVEALRSRGRPMIVMGDFNCDWSAADDGLRRTAAGLDLRAFRPEDDGLRTFPSNAPARRLDWILISPDIEFRDYRCWPDVLSDHLGVTAEIVIRRL